MATIISAGISDVGKKRSNNEDSFLIDDQQKLFIVADGMGGHNAGDVASQIVVETMARHMKDDPDAGETDASDYDETLSVASNKLLAGIHLANQRVHESAAEDENRKGMGATLSAIHFSDNCLTAANVGDSPIYLVHEGTIEPLHVLHTVIAEQQAIDPDGISEIEERYRHMLTRAMGTNETVQPDACEVQYFKGDILVICSDGLSNKVTPDDIHDIVSKEPPDKACQTLVDLANERDGDDNITAIVLRVKSVRGRGMGVVVSILDMIKDFFTGKR
ncbi:MAG: protein phosphatase 2C domain-containing protein [Desulfobacterales bacterium]